MKEHKAHSQSDHFTCRRNKSQDAADEDEEESEEEEDDEEDADDEEDEDEDEDDEEDEDDKEEHPEEACYADGIAEAEQGSNQAKPQQESADVRVQPPGSSQLPELYRLPAREAEQRQAATAK